MADPMETLRAHGWRMRAPFCFVRRGECLWLGADGWWRWIGPGVAPVRVRKTLVAVVWSMYGGGPGSIIGAPRAEVERCGPMSLCDGVKQPPSVALPAEWVEAEQAKAEYLRDSLGVYCEPCFVMEAVR